MKVRIFVPTAITVGESSIGALHTESRSVEGRTIGFLNNGWACLDILFDRFEKTLCQEHGVRRIVKKDIPLSSPADPRELAAVAEATDFVIVGLAN